MKKYNLFVLLPHLSSEQTKSISQEIIKIIEKAGGEIEKWEEYGKRKLSYVIKKIRHGFYLDYVLNLPTEKIESRVLGIIKELKLKPEILRFELSHYQDTKTLKHPLKLVPISVGARQGVSKNIRLPDGHQGRQASLPASRFASRSPRARLASKRVEASHSGQGRQKQIIKKSTAKESLIKRDREKPKISLEELDKKLDNILEAENI